MTKAPLFARQMMIFANEVPVISAMNPYRKIEDVFFDIWKRTNPKQITNLQEKLHVHLPTPQEKIQELMRETGVQIAINSLIGEAKQANTTLKVQKSAERVENVVPDTIPAVIKKEIMNFAKSEMHKNFGSKQEISAITHYEEKQKAVVKERNLFFSKKRIVSLSACDVFVGGKIDGKVNGKVIEVKNRVKRFMTPLPKYDIAQLQTYLFILGASEGELVECLRNDVVESKTTKVVWDQKMWDDEILPFLIRFSNALAQFMHDEEAQSHYLRGDAEEQKEIIRYHWMKDILLKD